MQHRKKVEELSVMDAVDNLTHMAEIDLTAPVREEGEPVELTEEQISERLHSLSWHDPEYFVYNRERVKETFRVIQNYLKQIYEKEKGQLRDASTQKGIQAIMLLAAEAAQKMDKYAEKVTGAKKEESIAQLKEYQDLQHYYQTKIVHKFQNYVEIKEGWQDEWSQAAEGDLLDVQRQGLKDLDTVRQDKEYELFMVRKEDGKPFFNRDLLRHLRLVGEFDEVFSESFGEDPFLRIKMIQDRDLHTTAKEILHLVAPYIDDYYKEALHYKDMEFVASINKAIMALMLAANPRNLMQNTAGKSCVSYFTDFHYYLRRALSSQEYIKYISNPPDSSHRFFHILLNLSHGLSTSFFVRLGNRKEMVAFIRFLIEEGGKGSSTQSATHSPVSIWNNLGDEDEHIRYLLKKYPNGPLMKAIDVFRADQQLIGFDPFAQENLPGQLYTLINDQMHISCLRMPCPVRQEYISKAELAEEFYGFLRSIGSEKRGQRHLLINLQDRTSWQEHARCLALEDLQKKAEFAKSLVVVTLPKSGDFYMQSGSYINLNDAKEFINTFKEQIASGEQCGYFLSGAMKSKEIEEFVSEAMKMIHRYFFGDKDSLLRKNRLDFIEIFYLFFTLKIIDVCKPDTISFTCKDAVDTGAAANAEFYAFIKMMNGLKPWEKDDKDFLSWMLYSSALVLRERAIDNQRLNRMLSALTVVNAELEAQLSEVIKASSKLYTLPFFKDLSVQEAQ